MLMEISVQEKIILWLLAEADESSYHGFEMSALHESLERRKIFNYKNLIDGLKEKNMIGVDRANNHHKAMYKILPQGLAAIGKHKNGN